MNEVFEGYQHYGISKDRAQVILQMLTKIRSDIGMSSTFVAVNLMVKAVENDPDMEPADKNFAHYAIGVMAVVVAQG